MGFKYRLWWTWDHRMNWGPIEPGWQTCGCGNPYLKRAETFLSDYKRAVDHAERFNINGIVIWGFLRDAHGGVAASQELCKYANDRGVRILPGVGTSHYGGIYYEGNHEFNATGYVEKFPDRRAVNAEGECEGRPCPSHPKTQQWLRDGMSWLYETFDVGGINLEHGDFAVCHCERCRELRSQFPAADPDYYKDMAVSILPAIETAHACDSESWITYATYTGFSPDTLKAAPAFVRYLPDYAICQWTLTDMLESQEEIGGGIYRRPAHAWPVAIGPPTKHNVGLLHQSDQWFSGAEVSCIVPLIREMCLKADAAGLEGLAWYGEANPDWTPAWLNYTAFEYFSERPNNTLQQFAEDRLIDVAGDKARAIEFIEILAREDRSPKQVKADFDRVHRDLWCALCWLPRYRRLEAWPTIKLWEWMFHLTLQRQCAADAYAASSG